MAELITVREFARRESCDEKQVRRGIDKGLLVKDSAGHLDAAQIGNGWRKTNRRGRDSAAEKGADTPPVVRTNVRPVVRTEVVRAPDAEEGETAADAAERIALTKAPYDRVEAERIKENYLALLKKLEYEQKEGSLVGIGVAEQVLFEASRAARDSWLNWPSRVGPLVAADLGLAADRVTEVLTAYVHEQIDQLGEPEADFTGKA
jgi:hypothetical protein